LVVDVRDRAWGPGVIERERPTDLLVGGGELELFVESLGRVNYGPGVGERKGLLSVRHGQQTVHGWTAQGLALDGEMPHVPWDLAAESEEPGFLRAFHDVDDVTDAYVAVEPGDGYLWLNGFLLGRYRAAGPQRALYAPGPLWRSGRNELVVLHLTAGTPALRLTDSPEWVD
jgi:beta-galactosidase